MSAENLCGKRPPRFEVWKGRDGFNSRWSCQEDLLEKGIFTLAQECHACVLISAEIAVKSRKKSPNLISSSLRLSAQTRSQKKPTVDVKERPNVKEPYKRLNIDIKRDRKNVFSTFARDASSKSSVCQYLARETPCPAGPNSGLCVVN